MIAVDLFCGCGGASLGFRIAGFKIIGAADVDQEACDTYERNLGVKPLREDLLTLDAESLLSSFSLLPGELDLLICCPPCQPFTQWAKTNGNPLKDRRRLLVPLVADFTKVFKPKFLLFENVPRLLKSTWRSLFESLLQKLTKLGYIYEWKVLNAADYGVPQRRRRLILVAANTRTMSKNPSSLLPRPCVNRWVTVREAISDLPPLEAGEKCNSIPNHVAPGLAEEKLAVVRKIPKNGGSLIDLPKKFWLPCQRRGGFTNVWARMWWDRPAPTITRRCINPSSGRFLHPEQDRPITPREAARLQSFPDWFTFPDKMAVAARLIGEAMPPLEAKAIGEHIMAILHDNSS